MAWRPARRRDAPFLSSAESHLAAELGARIITGDQPTIPALRCAACKKLMEPGTFHGDVHAGRHPLGSALSGVLF